MNKRTEVLLKDLDPDTILVQSDRAKEIMQAGTGEHDLLTLPLDQACYLKLATAEQLYAIRRAFPHAIAHVEWPEAVDRNRERMRRALRTARAGPLELIPENARRFVFEADAIKSLFTAAGIVGGAKYYRALSSCHVFSLCPVPPGKEGEVVKEPPAEWFPRAVSYEQAQAPCDCPDCEARNRP
jgi:hypothetical protein